MKRFGLTSAILASILLLNTNLYANEEYLLIGESESFLTPIELNDSSEILGVSSTPITGNTEGLEDPNFCGNGPREARLSVRHIEAGGIGYDDGYTTLEGFWGYTKNRFVPFVDIRGHVFNSGKFACNAGLGMRYLHSTRIFGLATYYDYRQSNILKTSNQIGVSLESLGRVWDVRLNGYFPFGKRKEGNFGSANGGSTTFMGFTGNNLLIAGGNLEFTMIGCSGEAGAHLGKIKDVGFYGAAGPYYFEGQGVNAYGGQVRLSASYKDYVKVEISNSYDNVFHNNFQGQLTLSMPTGGRSAVKRSGPSAPSCSDLMAMSNLMMQPVNRQEIIVLDQIPGSASIAIDPLTLLPLNFIFVDNTSSSLGTFESPYHSFTTALDNSIPSDYFYVYAGDGTSLGLNEQNYQLMDYQQVLGAGISQTVQTTLGAVTIPAQGVGNPNFASSSVGASVFSTANNNAFSGLNIVVQGNGSTTTPIYAIGSVDPHSGLIASNNTISLVNSSIAVYEPTMSGDVDLINNIVTSPGSLGSSGFFLQLVQGNSLVTINGNTLSGILGDSLALDPNGPSAITCFTGNTATSKITVDYNTINGSNDGIQLQTTDTSSSTAYLSYNKITNTLDAGALLIANSTGGQTVTVAHNDITDGVIGLSLNGRELQTVKASNNNFSNNTLYGANALVIDGIGSYTFTNNKMNDNSDTGLRARSQGTATINLTAQKNTATGNGLNGFYLFTRGNGTANYTVTEQNILSNNGLYGAHIVASEFSESVPSVLTATFSNNTASNSMLSGGAGLVIEGRGFGSVNTTVANNQLNQNPNAGMRVVSSQTSALYPLTITATGNTANNNQQGFSVSALSSSKLNLIAIGNFMNNNNFSNVGSGIYVGSENTSVMDANLSDNRLQFNDIGISAGTIGSSTGRFTVNGNNLTGSLNYGLQVTSANTSHLCLSVQNNELQNSATPSFLDRSSGTTFNIESNSGNNPAVIPPAGATFNSTCPY